jgi:hypothetical protein
MKKELHICDMCEEQKAVYIFEEFCEKTKK